MRRRTALSAALLAGLFSLGFEGYAFAQPQSSATAVKMAQDLVEQGRAFGEQGKWGEALDRFQRAAALSHKTSPQLAFYVGFAEARTGKLVAADVDLRRAIDLAHDANNAAVAKAAEAELPDLEARTPALTITIRGATTPASLQVDGSVLGVVALGNPMPLDPGDHTVVVQFAGGQVTKKVSLVERQRLTLPIDPSEAAGGTTPPPPPAPPPTEAHVVAPPPAAPPPAATNAPAPAPSDGSGRKKASLALVGVGGAALVTGGIFYLLSRSAYSPVSDACKGGGTCNLPSNSPLESNYHDAQTKQTLSIVFAGAGGALAVAGIVVYATRPSTALPGTSSASAILAPWVGAAGGGASLIGRF